MHVLPCLRWHLERLFDPTSWPSIQLLSQQPVETSPVELCSSSCLYPYFGLRAMYCPRGLLQLGCLRCFYQLLQRESELEEELSKRAGHCPCLPNLKKFHMYATPAECIYPLGVVDSHLNPANRGKKPLSQWQLVMSYNLIERMITD